MSWRNIFRRRNEKDVVEKTCLTTTVVKEEENPYVYESGEKTIYDCIQESKQLGFDMKKINAMLSKKEGKHFVSWFEGYKEGRSDS